MGSLATWWGNSDIEHSDLDHISCLKKDKKETQSSYKAMSECQKLPKRSTAVVPVASIIESQC